MSWEFALGLLLVGSLLCVIGVGVAWLYDRVRDSLVAASVAWALAVSGLFAFIVTRG